MLQRVKKIFIVLLISFAFLLTILFLTSIIYGDDICKVIISQVNKNIKTEISAKDYELKLVRYFPFASVTFYDVKIKSINGFKLNKPEKINESSCLEAKEVSIKFNLVQLLFKNYILKGIDIEEGKIQLLINSTGIENYKLWNDYPVKTSTEEIKFKIKNINLNKITIIYLNELKDLRTDFSIAKLNANGTFKTDEFDIDLKSALNYLIIKSNVNTYSINNKSNIKLHLVSNEKSIICNLGVLEFNNEKLNFSGEMWKIKPYYYSLNFSANDLNIAKISDLFKSFMKNYWEIKDGNAMIIGLISGATEKASLPVISIKTTVNNLSISYKNQFELNKINGKIDLTTKGQNSYAYYFSIKSLNGKIQNSDFKINGNYSITSSHTFDLKGNIDLNCKDLNKFLQLKDGKFTDGKSLVNFNLNGTLAFDATKLDFNTLNIGCEAKCADVELELFNGNLKLNHFNGEAKIENNNLNIKSLHGIANNNKLHFRGGIENIFGIFNDSIWHCNISGKILGSYVNLPKLLFSTNSGTDTTSTIELNTDILIDIDTLHYDDLIGYSVNGNLKYKYNTLLLSNITANICNGYLSNGLLKTDSENNKLSLFTKCDLKNINIKCLFNSFNNFGQKELTAKNIQGSLNGNITCKMQWDEDNKFVKDKFEGFSDFEINNGELINFQPIYKLSKFIEVSELNDIKFSKLKNKISVANKKFTIPNMEINSTAINLNMSGTHTLENEYEYHFKVLLSDILFKKAKKKKENLEFGKIEDDDIKGTSLYIKLQGVGNDYNISYDNKEAMKSFTNRLKQEKQELKSILKDEFGLFKNDTSARKTGLGNNKKAPVIEHDEFMPTNEDNKPADRPVKKQKPKIEEWKDE